MQKEKQQQGVWLKRTTWALGGLLVGMGTVFRFWNLNKQSLWQDEIHTATYVVDKPSLWEVIHRVATWDLHSPVFYILLRIHVWIQGVFHMVWNEGNLRVLPALLGSLALPVVYLLFKRSFKSPGLALVGLFIAAINIFAIYYSQELRMYAAILLFAPAFLYFYLTLWDEADNLQVLPALAFIASAVLLMYTSLVCLFFVFGIWFSALLLSVSSRKNPKLKQRVFLIGVIIFILYAPWLGVMLHQSMTLKAGVGIGQVIINLRELLKMVFENLLCYEWKLSQHYNLLNKCMRIIIPFSLVHLFFKEHRREHVFLVLGFGLSFLTYYIVTFGKDFQIARYFSPWWPFAIYLLLAGLVGIKRSLERFVPGGQWLGAGLMVLLLGYFTFVQAQAIQYYFKDFEKEDWRSLTKYLNTQQQPGDVILVPGSWDRDNYRYYGTQLPFVTFEEFKRREYSKAYKRFFYTGNEQPKEEDLKRRSYAQKQESSRADLEKLQAGSGVKVRVAQVILGWKKTAKHPNAALNIPLIQTFKQLDWPFHCKKNYSWEPDQP